MAGEALAVETCPGPWLPYLLSRPFQRNTERKDYGRA